MLLHGHTAVVLDLALAGKEACIELAREVPAGGAKEQDVDARQRVVDRRDEEAVEGEDKAGQREGGVPAKEGTGSR